MLRIRMHTTWPQMGAHTQLSTLSSHSVPADLSAHYEQPLNEQHMTAATVDINTYPSRHAYGFSTMDDVTREEGQKGLQAIAERTSRFTQEAWELIENGPKQDGGAYCIQIEKSKFKSSLNEGRDWHIELTHVPDPILTAHPSEISGGIDPGSYDVNIETKKDGAVVQYNPGSCELYLKQRGSVEIWTEGSVDTFA